MTGSLRCTREIEGTLEINYTSIKFLQKENKIFKNRNSYCDAAETNLTSIHEDAGSLPGLIHWVGGSGIAVSCGEVEDMAQIPCCCGCGVGRQLSLRFNP